jgi:hypothetical protein
VTGWLFDLVYFISAIIVSVGIISTTVYFRERRLARRRQVIPWEEYRHHGFTIVEEYQRPYNWDPEGKDR